MQNCHTLDALVLLYQSREHIEHCLEVDRALLSPKEAASGQSPSLGGAVVISEVGAAHRLHIVMQREEAPQPGGPGSEGAQLLVTTSGERLPVKCLSGKRSLADFADDVLEGMVAEFIVAEHSSRIRADACPGASTVAGAGISPGLPDSIHMAALLHASRTPPLFSFSEVVDGALRRARAQSCLEPARCCNALMGAAQRITARRDLNETWKAQKKKLKVESEDRVMAELRPYDPCFDAALVQALAAARRGHVSLQQPTEEAVADLQSRSLSGLQPEAVVI